MPFPEQAQDRLRAAIIPTSALADGRPALRVVVDEMPPGGAGLTDAELRAQPVHTIIDSMPAGGASLTNTELRATPVPVSGTVAVSGTVPVSGTVAVSSAPTTAVTGPVTDAQLRASAVPVSGVFYPATQPVSAAALPLPTGAGTEATLAAIKAKTDNLDVLLSTRTKPADTQPVSGTFWQATQPVSGPLTDAQMRASAVPVSLATAPTTPVTGTFWQGTQPVSGPLTDAQMRASAVPVSGAFFQATQPVSAAALPLPTGAATEATLAAKLVTPTAKGTQAATATPTQDLKDSGRVLKTYIATALAGATAEALISLTPYADLVAGAPATTFAVTAGKRLRIQCIQVTWRNNTAAAGGVTVRLRLLAGTVLVGSPVHCTLNATTALATIGSGQSACADFPDGLELSGTMQFGLTQIAVGVVVGLDVQVMGYEY